jgi:hypothetical protein
LARVDSAGRLRAADVAELRPALRELLTDVATFDHPEALFGPWTSLPTATRQTLRALLARELRQAVRWHPSGRLWPWTVNRLVALAEWAAGCGLGRLSSAANRVGLRLYAGPLRLRQASVRRLRARRWWRASRPGLFDLVAACGRMPNWLEGDWADQVSVPRRLRGPFRDRDRNVVQGYLTGLDLIPTDSGVWCIEANLNTSFTAAVRRPYLDPEPAVDVAVREALAMGAERIWWVEQLFAPTRSWLMQELVTRAHAEGLEVRFLEDWRVPRGEERPPGIPPRAFCTDSGFDVPPNTLVLRRNSLPLGPDYLLADKEPFTRGLAYVLRERGECRVAVPEMARRPGRIPEPAAAGLPNLVYKYPDLGKGEGVHFLRVRDADQAEAMAREIDARTGEPPGLFQPFLLSRLLPGRRIYDVRCEVFISPRGVRRVFGLRRESTRSLPETLETGIVPGSGVFTSNVSQGGRFAEMDADEAVEVWAAADAVGEGLLALFSRAYDLER